MEWKQVRTIAAGTDVVPVVMMIGHMEVPSVLVAIGVAVTDERRLDSVGRVYR